MSEDTIAAYLLLLARINGPESRQLWFVERAEEALSEFLRHPERCGEPHVLVRDALANARKKLERRQGLRERFQVDLWRSFAARTTESGYDVVDLLDFVGRLGGNDRLLLGLAAEGRESEEVAEVLNLPTTRTRERLSRARGRARQVWTEAA